MNLGPLSVLSQLWLAQQGEKAVSAPAPVTSAAPGAATDAAQSAAQTPQGSPFGMLPMIVLFFVAMYFMMIRPQQKRDRERRDLLSSLEKGDAVVTSGGICGTIVNLSENTAIVRVDEGVTLEFVRSAITQVTSRGSESKKK